MSENIKVRWLVDNEQTKIAPKTFSTQILNEDGTHFKDTVEASITEIDEKIVAHSNNSEIHVTAEEKEGYATKEYVENLYTKLNSNTVLGFYCIEDVTIVTNGISKVYPANSNVEIAFIEDDVFEIIPTSDSSILSLTAFPGALGTFYTWLEGVALFSNILFDMNDEAMYSKWSQGNQGVYHVQSAQYTNCIFWSDNPYISDVSKRTNYTLTHTSQLPLCYSTIPDNTFKSFYLAGGVNSDPNWSNQAYKDSFAKANWATQAFSYYGARTIGLPGMFDIVLPKDCRGLMFDARNIENAGTFNAVNTTNFGAKSGSWREAFGDCTSLRRLYIKNLKVSLNISWSPIDYNSISYIISSAANTNAITIYVSPYTYNLLSPSDFELAASKNITIALLTTNYVEDRRLSAIDNKADKVEVDTNLLEINTSILNIENGTTVVKKATQDASGNVIESTYETKTDAQTKLDTAKEYTDTKTANLVSSTVVDNKISAHNTSTSAHSDIRELITDLTTKLNNFLDIDDATSDQLSEVLQLIENNKGTLESLTTSKINVSDIIDNLTTASADKVLSANQGVAIKVLIDALQEAVDGKADSEHEHNATNITSGTLIEDVLPVVPIEKGGTGSSNAETARANLGITPENIGAATVDHIHEDIYYTKDEIDGNFSDVDELISDIIDGTTPVAEAGHASSADTATTSGTAEKAIQDENGNVIVSTYETKDEASAKLDTAKAYTDTVGDSKQDKLSGIQGQVVGFDESGSAVAQDIVQSDWNQDNESAPDYIKNKPLVSVGGDTLTWDGNTEGLETDGTLYKVSNAILSADDFANGFTVVVCGESAEFTVNEITVYDGVGIVGPDGTFILYTSDLENPETGDVLRAGVYFNTNTQSLTIPGYTGFAKKQINPELLPMTTVTIPAGRMRGDIDGDGEITESDKTLLQNHINSSAVLTDATQLLCADVNGDGSIASGDQTILNRIVARNSGWSPGRGGDILNNWTVNPNYQTEEMQFYTDISVPGLTTNSSAVVTIQGTFEVGFFKGECMADTLRLYAKLCPIAETKAVVSFGDGDGTVVCVTDGVETRDGIVTATIPAGRMKGDVDGDGRVTSADKDLIMQYISEKITFDNTQKLCADIDDVDNDGITSYDGALILQIEKGTAKLGIGGDVLGNWTVNPNYASEDAQFYTDIAIDGITANSSAKVTVKGTHYEDVFVGAECMDGAVRIWAINLPIEPANCLVQYGPGDGSAIITVEKSISHRNNIYTATMSTEYDDDNNKYYVLDKTFSELEDAYREGYIVNVSYSQKLYHLYLYNESSYMSFMCVEDAGKALYSRDIYIDSDNVVTYTNRKLTVSGTAGQFVGFDENGKTVAQDIESETWTFTLEDGSTVTKKVMLL